MRQRPSLWQVNAPLLGLALLLLVLVLAGAIPRTYHGFVEPYLWRPLVQDEGFNVFNTLLLILIVAPLTLWIHRLLDRHGVRLDLPLVFAPTLLVPIGSMVRVLVDSDYFAPFDEQVRQARPELAARATCVPEIGGGFLQECLSLLLITPPIYVLFVLLLGGLGRLAYQGERIRRASGERAARVFDALCMLAGLSLYLSWWASDPAHVRLAPPAAWAALAFAAGGLAIVGFQRALRRRDWRASFFAYTLPLFLLVCYPTTVWLLGGHPDWRPMVPPQPQLLLVGLLGTLLFLALLAYLARTSGNGAPRKAGTASSWIRFGIQAIILSFCAFFAMVFVAQSTTRLDSHIPRLDASWPLAALFIAALVLGGHHLARKRGLYDESLIVLTRPHNLLVLFAQLLDGLMTSLGLDLFGASEKHVLPRTLVAWVDSLDLPAVWDAVPTALVFIPFKIMLTLLLLWALDVRYRDELAPHANLVALAKGVAFVVGLAPGLRDVLRLSLGV